MAEYIIKQKVIDRMGCCLAYANAEYKAAKDEFTKARIGVYISAIQAMIDVAGSVEAANEQPVRRGRWIEYHDLIRCSVCGFEVKDEYHEKRDMTSIETSYDFCPKCSADMREPETTKR